MLSFPRHFSLLLYVSVLVKGRLLGMTGGEVAAGDRGTLLPEKKKVQPVILRERL